MAAVSSIENSQIHFPKSPCVQILSCSHYVLNQMEKVSKCPTCLQPVTSEYYFPHVLPEVPYRHSPVAPIVSPPPFSYVREKPPDEEIRIAVPHPRDRGKYFVKDDTRVERELWDVFSDPANPERSKRYILVQNPVAFAKKFFKPHPLAERKEPEKSPFDFDYETQDGAHYFDCMDQKCWLHEIFFFEKKLELSINNDEVINEQCFKDLGIKNFRYTKKVFRSSCASCSIEKSESDIAKVSKWLLFTFKFCESGQKFLSSLCPEIV